MLTMLKQNRIWGLVLAVWTCLVHTFQASCRAMVTTFGKPLQPLQRRHAWPAYVCLVFARKSGVAAFRTAALALMLTATAWVGVQAQNTSDFAKYVFTTGTASSSSVGFTGGTGGFGGALVQPSWTGYTLPGIFTASTVRLRTTFAGGGHGTGWYTTTKATGTSYSVYATMMPLTRDTTNHAVGIFAQGNASTVASNTEIACDVEADTATTAVTARFYWNNAGTASGTIYSAVTGTSAGTRVHLRIDVNGTNNSATGYYSTDAVANAESVVTWTALGTYLPGAAGNQLPSVLQPGTSVGYVGGLAYDDTTNSADTKGVQWEFFSAANPTLSAGTATPTVASSTSVSLTATDATGGATPYTYLWQISPDNGSNAPTGSWSTITGTGSTSRTGATATGLTTGTKVWFRLQYTDATSQNIVYSAAVSATPNASPTILTALPSPINTSASHTITFVGQNTHWTTTAPTISIANTTTTATAGSVTVVDATHVTCPITTNSIAGSFVATLTNVTDGAVVAPSVIVGVPTVSVAPTTLTTGQTNQTFTFTGVNTVWTQDHPTVTINNTGSSAALNATPAYVYTDDTHFTVQVDAGASGGSFTATLSAPAITTTNSVTITVGPQTIAVTTANNGGWAYSQLNWNVVNGTSATTPDPGAWVRFSCTTVASSSTATFNFTSSFGSVSAVPADLAWKVDGGAVTRVSMASSGASTIVVTLTGATSHTVEIRVVMLDYAVNKWSGSNRVVLNSVTLTDGSATTFNPTVLPSFWIFVGDSITEGEGADALATSGHVSSGDSAASWAFDVAAANGVECSIVACGGQSGAVGVAADGATPIFATAIPSIYSGVSRLSGGKWLVQPAAIVFNPLTNDALNGGISTATMGTSVNNFLTLVRGYCTSTSTPIYLIDPFGAASGSTQGTNAAAGALNGFNAYQTTPDAFCFHITQAANLSALVPMPAGSALAGSYDRVHPNRPTYALFGAYISQKIQATSGATIKIIKASRQESRQAGRN